MDTSGIHVWLVLWKAFDVLEAHAMRSIESVDMCITDFGILELLMHKGPVNINVLGEKLSLASGSTTAAVDRLEKRNLVRRVASESDRRAKYVELTKQGDKLISSAFEKHKDDMERVASVLTRTERIELLKLLKKLGKSAAGLLESERS